MRGLLLLSDPNHPQIQPERCIAEAEKHNIKVQWDETAAIQRPPLLSDLQLHLYRLRRQCSWLCVMAEGEAAAHAIILAAQLPVDRLILIGDLPFRRSSDRRRRRLNAFARRNLSLITAEIVAVGMDDRLFHRFSAGLGCCCGALVRAQDAAELWQKRESFLLEAFPGLGTGKITCRLP